CTGDCSGFLLILLAPPPSPLFPYTTLFRSSAVSVVAFILYTNAAVIAVHFHGAPFFLAAVFPLLLCLPIGRELLLRRERLLVPRSEEHTSELQSRVDLVCRLLLEKKNNLFI